MSDFSNQLLKWYRLNFRQLPWRETIDPYKIWVSEIILQQTRVTQGLPYYHKIIQHFPTVRHMAKASEEEILKLWQGLGYYSRARNMHTTAKWVSENYKGKFPASYSELISLKGIGDYTAAAISSFSSNEKRAVLDGNVFRVLARLFGIYEAQDSTIGKKIFKLKAEELLSHSKPGLHNQAIMEFGAVQCIPANPDCKSCIFSKQCIAFNTGKVKELPVKKKKNKVQKRYFHYYVFTDSNSVLMKKRMGKDIWQGLYDFPMVESNSAKLSKTESMNEKEWLLSVGVKNENVRLVRMKHLLSHRELHIVFKIYSLPKLKSIAGFEKIKTETRNFPGVPQVIMKLLQNENWFRKK